MRVGAVDFFVSYTSADRPWAEWIAWELEQAGHSVIVQAWDVLSGSNFVLAMHKAAEVAQRTIAVLSPAFLESPYCAAEWASAFRADPAGKQRKLVPVRVRDCDPGGLLGAIAYVDVTGLSEASSRAALLAGVTNGRAKPTDAPAFPGRAAGHSEAVRRPDSGAAIFNVPVMTRTFVGRTSALKRLAAGLADDGAIATTQVHAIHGLGGVGKTQLAARYARQQRHAYDVIWWLRAEQPETLRTDLADLAAALGLVDGDVDAQDAIDSVRRWLEHNRRWLLVFDNAPGPDAIADLLPEGNGGHVLVTSRAYADWRALNATPLALDVWKRAESRRFLTRRTGERDRTVLDDVARALGDLPLALEQAAAYTNTNAITLSGYLERLHDRAPELFSAGEPARYEHTVATVWQLAFEQIAQHPIADRLLGMCSLLAPERIPRELLKAAFEPSHTAEVSPQESDDAITLLLRYALLTPAAEQTFDMHRLIGQLTRDRTDPATQANAAAVAATALDTSWPRRPWEHEQWPACERLLAHVLAATEHAMRHGAAPEQTASVLERAGQYEAARAQLTSARGLTERALAINEAFYGPEHPQIASTLTNLGNVQQQLGELEQARMTVQRALAIKEAIYGPEDPQIATTLTHLAGVQQQLGELEQARMALQRALAIKEAAYGPEHPDVAITLTHLGILHQRPGELEQARVTVQQALAIAEAVFGPRHPQVASTLTNLAIVQQQLGELEQACVTVQRALAIKEAAHGPEHLDVAITLTHLGGVHQQLGELKQARETLQRALAIKEAIYGPEHPDVAVTLTHLGILQQQLGELAHARAITQLALATFERFFGPDHTYSTQARSILESMRPSEELN